jgi:hypothetical protein
MTTLELMYVYYDNNGNIKTISNEVQNLPTETYSFAMFPLPEVEAFLMGKKNPFDFNLKTVKRATGTEYKIVRKQPIDVSLIRVLDNFLTEVTRMPRRMTWNAYTS